MAALLLTFVFVVTCISKLWSWLAAHLHSQRGVLGPQIGKKKTCVSRPPLLSYGVPSVLRGTLHLSSKNFKLLERKAFNWISSFVQNCFGIPTIPCTKNWTLLHKWYPTQKRKAIILHIPIYPVKKRNSFEMKPGSVSYKMEYLLGPQMNWIGESGN